jgi:pyruvate/2-oxoglutarate dehydrogenase complex dihydrolipoamide dehydrogenase (E3) component
MVASARVAYLARRAADFGISTGSLKVDMQKVRERKRAIVDSFRSGGEKRLAAAGVEVMMGRARFVGSKEVEVSLHGGETKRVTAESIYINVGCRPSRPQIPGLGDVDQASILDSTSIQELGEVPEHLVVLGGGAIGVEFAQLFRRFGARVTIVHRGKRLLGRGEDPELAQCLHDILEDDGIKILLDSSATKIEKSHNEKLPLTIHTQESTKDIPTSIQASHMLVATGRVPNTDLLNLSAAGIKTSLTGDILASLTLETNIDGVYVLGDVKGGPAFTHVSYDDFRIIRSNLAGTPRTTDDRAPYIPSVIYTDPQFAHVGPKWGELSRYTSTTKLISYSMPGSWIARGLETDETRGMMKAVVDDESGRIICFSAIGTEAGEVMSVVQMAMLGGRTWEQLRDDVWAHPSWSESLNNLWGGEKKVVEF